MSGVVGWFLGRHAIAVNKMVGGTLFRLHAAGTAEVLGFGDPAVLTINNMVATSRQRSVRQIAGVRVCMLP